MMYSVDRGIGMMGGVPPIDNVQRLYERVTACIRKKESKEQDLRDLLDLVEREADYNLIYELYEKALEKRPAYAKIILDRFPICSLNTKALDDLVMNVINTRVGYYNPVLHEIFKMHINNRPTLDYDGRHEHFLFIIVTEKRISQYLIPILDICKKEREEARRYAMISVSSLVAFPPGLLPVCCGYANNPIINNLDTRGKKEFSLFSHAVLRKNTDVIEWLMREGCDPLQPFAASFPDTTILDEAVRQNVHASILKYRPDLADRIKK